MKKKCATQYIMPKVQDIPTVFGLKLRMSAEISVLKQLGITGRILRNMRMAVLTNLYCLLQYAMLDVETELDRRRGIKM